MHPNLRFSTLAVLFLSLAATSYATPTIAARLSIQESAVQTLGQISQSTMGVNLDKFHIRQIEFFLVSGADQTLQPVVFIKADPSGELGVIGMGAMLSLDFKQEGEWLVGVMKTNSGHPPAPSATEGENNAGLRPATPFAEGGDPNRVAMHPPEAEGSRGSSAHGVSDADLSALIALAAQPPAYPFCLKAHPPVIISALRHDKNFEKEMDGGSAAAILQELETLDSVEIRGLFNASTLRIVTILRSHPDSALNAFLSQRLPAALPAEHSLMNASGALVYGYSVYNTKACTDYMAHIAALFKASVPEISQKLENLSAQWSPAAGYSAFVMRSKESMPYVYTKGFWTPTSAPEMIKAQLDLADGEMKAFMPPAANAAVAGQNNFTVKEAFKIGDLPVWKTCYAPPEKAPEVQKKLAASMTNFYALRDGSLLSAPNAEALTQFIQSFNSPASGNANGNSNTFAQAFVHYPTIYSQMKIDSDAIVENSQKALPQPVAQSLSLPHCEPIYLAASIGLGQAAITFDIPTKLFENLEAVAKAAKPASKPTRPMRAPASKPLTVPPGSTRL